MASLTVGQEAVDGRLHVAVVTSERRRRHVRRESHIDEPRHVLVVRSLRINKRGSTGSNFSPL